MAAAGLICYHAGTKTQCIFHINCQIILPCFLNCEILIGDKTREAGNEVINNFSLSAQYLLILTLSETINRKARFVKDIKVQEMYKAWRIWNLVYHIN